MANRRVLVAAAPALLTLLAGCAGAPEKAAGPAAAGPNGLLATPPAEFCKAAQRIVGQTDRIGDLVVHGEFDPFVKSKTSIEPLTIHEFIWYADDARTRPVAISCKLKSADHLNTAFGAGTAGPEGVCQDVNRETLTAVLASLPRSRRASVVLDPNENIFNDQNPGMAGPDWLAPFVPLWRDNGGVLHLKSKAFRVDWADPRFATLDGRFRGVHYCHLIAPSYLRAVLAGEAEPGASVGRVVARTPPR